jgi:hypothetical protein
MTEADGTYSIPRQTGRAAPPQAIAQSHQALMDALDAAQGASFYLADGIEMIGEIDAPRLHFIAMGLEAQIAAMTKHLEAATAAAMDLRPASTMTEEEVMQIFAKKLADDMRVDITPAELPSVVTAYRAEAEAADPHTACGLVLDRALRLVRAEGREVC